MINPILICDHMVIRVNDNNDVEESSDLDEISHLEVIRNLTMTTRPRRQGGRVTTLRGDEFFGYFDIYLEGSENKSGLKEGQRKTIL